MPNFIDKLKNRSIEPAPVQNVAATLREKMEATGEIERIGGPKEMFEQQKWMIEEMARLGLGTGIDSHALSGSYYANLLKTCLDVNIAGGNLAVDLSTATADLIKVMDPNKSLREKSRIAFEICESLVKQKGNSSMVKIAKNFPVIFEPWVDLVKVVADNKKAVLGNMSRLDRAVQKSENMLDQASKLIKTGGLELTKSADKYDQQLGFDKEIKEIQDSLLGLGKDMITSLTLGDRRVGSIARKIAEEKKRLAEIPEMAIKSNRAIGEVLQTTATDMLDTAAVQAMTTTSKSIVIAQQANLIAGTAVPMLAITGLAGAIQTASWWNIYTTYKLMNEIGGSPDLSLTPREVRKAIAASNEASRQRYLAIKNQTIGKVIEGEIQ